MGDQCWQFGRTASNAVHQYAPMRSQLLVQIVNRNLAGKAMTLSHFPLELLVVIEPALLLRWQHDVIPIQSKITNANGVDSSLQKLTDLIILLLQRGGPELINVDRGAGSCKVKVTFKRHCHNMFLLIVSHATHSFPVVSVAHIFASQGESAHLETARQPCTYKSTIPPRCAFDVNPILAHVGSFTEKQA